MSTFLIGGVTLAYTISAVEQVIRANWATALFLVGCAIANIGIVLQVRA